MAYTKEYTRQCEAPYCQRRAMVEVFNHRNESKGVYCRKHGDEMVKELTNWERQQFNGAGQGASKA